MPHDAPLYVPEDWVREFQAPLLEDPAANLRPPPATPRPSLHRRTTTAVLPRQEPAPAAPAPAPAPQDDEGRLWLVVAIAFAWLLGLVAATAAVVFAASAVSSLTSALVVGIVVPVAAVGSYGAAHAIRTTLRS